MVSSTSTSNVGLKVCTTWALMGQAQIPTISHQNLDHNITQMTGGSSSHAAAPQAPSCVNWDDDMDDFMPPKPWPPTHDVPPSVHEPRCRKERKGKGRGSSSHAVAPQAPT